MESADATLGTNDIAAKDASTDIVTFLNAMLGGEELMIREGGMEATLPSVWR